MKKIINIYRKLPFKPFQGILRKLYQRYKKLNRNRIVIATRDGIRYRLDLNEPIDSSIYYEGCFEPITTSLINKFVKEGMTVLDIGANIGCHTLRFAKLVGDNGKVIAFEPMSWAFSKLNTNIALNGFKNITLEKIVLSNINQQNQLAYFRTSWKLDGKAVSEVKEYVDIFTLDEYVRKVNLAKIDFIKLDVDGYEYKVLLGGQNTIKKLKPIILVELGKYTLEGCGDNLEDLIDLLISLNYSFYSEETLVQYKNKDDLINAVPSDSTINVLCKPTIYKTI